jgi:hypothetical protein
VTNFALARGLQFGPGMQAIRTLLLIAGAVASVATSQVEGGDRTGDDTCVIDCDDTGPMCPAGETCSDDTPNGLYFGGMRSGSEGPFGLQWPRDTVIGGEQTIRIYLDGDGTQPLDLPFDASMTTPALSVQRTAGATVTVRGEAQGSGRLRITEPGTDLLYDRIELGAGDIDEISVLPAGRLLFDADLLGDHPPLAAMVGGDARVTALLYAADGTRLVDETLQFDAAAGLRPDPEGFVDTVQVSPSAPGDVEIVARSGDRVGYFTVTGVDAPDAVVVSYDDELPLEVTVDSGRVFCFRATAGQAFVLGAEWSYRATGRASLEVADDDVISHCIRVLGDEVGSATLTVTASGVSSDFAVNVVEASSAREATPDGEPIAPHLGGDRAYHLDAVSTSIQPLP